MQGLLQTPSATAFDAIASSVSLLVYLAVAMIALARAPRGSAARVFLVVALASGVPYALSPLQWWQGNGVYTPAVLTWTSVSFAIGSAALFHFTQVFPWRRPWIRQRAAWLAAAYLVPPVPVAVIAWMIATLVGPATTGAGGIGAVSDAGIAIALLLTIPLLVLIGVVLPFSGVMSLVKSWQEAKRAGDRAARTATLWMLISQLGGGVLAVLVVPMLDMIGVGPPWATIIAALSYAFALGLPMAFGRYGARASDAPASTPQLHNSATPK